MASTSTSDHDDKASGFFKLPREIRDLVYSQPKMLERLPLREPPETKYLDDKQLDFVKLRESLLLVSHQFNAEYREICESRIGIHHASNVHRMHGPLIQPTTLLQRATAEARVLHLHIGNWCMTEFCDDEVGLLDLLVDWTSRMPKLQAITLVAYMEDRHLPEQEQHAKIIRDATARLFVAVEKLSRVSVVLMDYAEQWQIRNHPGKDLLMQWTSGESPPCLSYNAPVKFVESCCDHLITEDLNEWDNDWLMHQVMETFAEDYWPEMYAAQLRSGEVQTLHQSHDATRGALFLQTPTNTNSNHNDHTHPATRTRPPIAKD
jgi:hypothetical protein